MSAPPNQRSSCGSITANTSASRTPAVRNAGQRMRMTRFIGRAGGVAAWLRACSAGAVAPAGRRRATRRAPRVSTSTDVGVAVGDRHRREAGDDDQRRPGEGEPDHREAPPRRRAGGSGFGASLGFMAIPFSAGRRRSTSRAARRGPCRRPPHARRRRRAGRSRKRIGWAPGPSAAAACGGSCTASGTQRASVGASSTSATRRRSRPARPSTPMWKRCACSVAFMSCRR